MSSLTIEQAAAALGKSTKTIYRYIANGKIKAEMHKGAYRILEIPDQVTKERPTGQTGQTRQKPVQSDPSVDYTALLTQIETLNREVGFWRGKYDELSKLLAPPKPLPWYKRLFRQS